MEGIALATSSEESRDKGRQLATFALTNSFIIKPLLLIIINLSTLCLYLFLP